MNFANKIQRPAAFGLVAFGLGAIVTYLAMETTGWILPFRAKAPGSAQAHEHDHGGDHHAGHGGEEATVAVTLWSGETELFIERPYPVQGEPAEMLVHLTVLKTGEPVREGVLTVEAAGPEGGQVQVRVEQPSRPGIFTPEITFPHPGFYQVRLRLQSPQLTEDDEVIDLPAIGVFVDAPAARRAAEQADEEEPADAITFLKEQQWRVGLLATEVMVQELVEHLTVPGTVVVPPGAEGVVQPPIAGRVLPPPAGPIPTVGETVSEGQVVAQIEATVSGFEASQLIGYRAQVQALDAELAAKQLEAETEVRTAEANVELAQQNHARLKSLSGRGITAEKDLLTAKYELRRGRAELEGARRKLEPYAQSREKLAGMLGQLYEAEEFAAEGGPLRLPLRSPISGRVVEADITPGEQVKPEHRLFRIVNLQNVWIEARVSEYDLGRVEQVPGTGIRPSAYPDRLIPLLDFRGGRLVDVGAIVDPTSRTVPVRYEMLNPDGLLRAGMFVDVLIETARREQSLAIPMEAIVDEDGHPVVYVQLEGETFQRRPVELGIRDGERVEIRSGLEPGDRVVTSGAYAIRLSTLSGAMPIHHH